MRDARGGSVSAAMSAHLRQVIASAGGWIGFDRHMHEALYAPGLGYYARGDLPFGHLPRDGSDFVTAPELSPFFGRALAAQVAQGLSDSGTTEVFEFGAGSGALAEQLLGALGEQVSRYTIVEVSAGLRARQRERLAAFGDKVAWAQVWPQRVRGVVVGNEVLDAMPVRLMALHDSGWQERGVVWRDGALAWEDREVTGADAPARSADRADRPGAESATGLPPHWPPADAGELLPGTVTECHEQAQAFIATLAQRLERGLALFIDYGFPQAEYYHPQRTGGTLMCHRGHQADADPLADPGLKDITSHLDFTALALAAQDAGLDVAGYTSQAWFLLNCGIAPMLEAASLRERAAAQKLLTEHEMGELFKVIAFTRGIDSPLIGFAQGDRSHRL